ncbi:ABC-three component system protein [Hathewaya massiliensis]|uniref:ABC-three component system protein n=1 Tax=Hathewaya massiliensis TaxID=1964382 RepID=UPI001159D54F|nr:ABC-three component system protein [Hathewaya massiliensis]
MKSETYFYHTIFDNQLLESYGDEFEQKFYSVMYAKYDNFIKIESQGRIGDRKCDGYIKGEGIFFQAYSPKDSRTSDASIQKYAIKKLYEDFEGLYMKTKEGYWEPITQFNFVFNNKRGNFPDLIEAIKNLEIEYPNIKFKPFDRSDLLKIFDSLDENDKMSISGAMVPEINPLLLDNNIMYKIIEHLLNLDSSQLPQKLIAPDFNEKLNFNSLCPYYTLNLSVANYSVDKLNSYLDSFSDNIENELCEKFQKLYEKAKIEFPNNSDSQFKYILDNSFDYSQLDNANKQLYISNCYIILSKYFESCDIFEEPS